MANPKRRHSNSRTRLRRTHDVIRLKSLSKCSNCGASILPHRICPECGYYRGRQFVILKAKGKKEEQK